MLNYKTYDNLALDIKRNISKVPHDVDLFVGIPRSGIIPAYMIALELNKRACSFDEFIRGEFGSVGKSGRMAPNSNPIKKVLLVDDSINTGSSAKELLQCIHNNGPLRQMEIGFLAVYATSSSSHLVDHHLEILEQPRMFQWNYKNHSFLERACLDMDGVLCVDPTEEENDDGKNYIKFMREARPLHIPNYGIHAIVTSRLEKYRNHTEEWLHRHGVRYEHLFMLNLESKEERQRSNAHGKYKAGIYQRLPFTRLFIESERSQAVEIHAITKKDVFCSASDELFSIYNGLAYEQKEKYRRNVKIKDKIIKIMISAIPVRTYRKKLRRRYLSW